MEHQQEASAGQIDQQAITGMPPCPESGEYCYYCKRRYPKEHMRERRMNFSMYPIAYCVLCDAAIAAGQIHG